MERLRDLADQSFNPFMDEGLAFGETEDPWPLMADQRASTPVAKGEYRTFFGGGQDPALAHLPHYTAWTYAAADAIFSDPALYSSAIAHKINVEPAFGRILVVMDPPEHTRYRRFLQAVFSPRRVREWTDGVIRPLVHALIDGFAANSEAELVARFTQRYPFDAVYRLLDLPADDLALFHKLAVTQTFAITPYAAQAREAGGHLADYFQGLIDARRQSPGDDLISQLVLTEVDGERLEDEIVVSFLRHILNASADTSYRTTGSLLVALLRDPALLAEITADRALVPLAIEEALRWEGPVLNNFRTATRDHVLGGVAIEAGAVVHVIQGSANRDETCFEHPDRFDIRRSRRTSHLGFGGGPHQCVGMSLARAQIREAVNALLDRLPGLHADPAALPPTIRGYMFRKPPELRVRFN
jgi:cytochrome P450